METLVARIVTAGATASIFVYFALKLVVTPWLKAKHEQAWWRNLVTNGFALLLGEVFAFALMFLLVGVETTELIVEMLLIGFMAACVATFGYEALKNYQLRSGGQAPPKN